MSEPIELVEEELRLIKEICDVANEQFVLKEIRQQNNANVRAWRLNVMRRVEKAQEAITGVLTEDEYKTIKAVFDSIDERLDTLQGMSLESAEDVNQALSTVEGIRAELKKEYNVFQEKKIPTMEISDAYHQLAERYNNIHESFEEQRKIQEKVEEKNSQIEENNQIEEKKENEYQQEVEDYIESINSILRPLANGKNFFEWQSDGSIKEMDQDHFADDLAHYIRASSKTPWDTITPAVLEEFPVEFRDYIDNNIGNDINALQDFNLMKTLSYNFVDYIIQSFEAPEEPTLEYEEFEEVPEIQLPHLKTEDLKFGELSPDFIRSQKKIPDSVIEELENYRKGKFSYTVQNADRINEIAEKYNLLKLEVIPNDGKQSVRTINQKIRELIEVQNSFGSERNSRTGQSKINAFVSATKEFLGHTRNQKVVFERYYEEFESTAEDLKDWINRAWWQMGGQPENHHSAGKNDNSATNYAKKVANREKYSGPSL